MNYKNQFVASALACLLVTLLLSMSVCVCVSVGVPFALLLLLLVVLVPLLVVGLADSRAHSSARSAQARGAFRLASTRDTINPKPLNPKINVHCTVP